MIRTQIYLPEVLHKKLTQIRDLTGVSIASFIREAVELKIGKTEVNDNFDILKLTELDITGDEKNLSKKN